MSHSEENELFLEGNIENTYEELTKVVNAKNDIKSCITLSAEKFIQNEMVLEELQDVLHNIRMKITSNPILRELNIVTKEDAIFQRKLAEGIYLELPDLSSRLDLYQENFLKFNEEYNKVKTLHSAIEEKLENKVNIMSSLKGESTNKYAELVKNFEIDMSRECQDLRDNIGKLLENIAKEDDISKSLSYEIQNKKNFLQKLSEMDEHNLENLVGLDDFESESDGKDINRLYSEKGIELDNEISELIEREKESFTRMNELKQQKSSHQVAKIELLKMLDFQQSLLKKTVLSTSIQDLKSLLTKKTEEFFHLKENIFKQENSSSKIESNLRLSETEINDITDGIQSQKQINEQQVEKKEEINESKDTLENNIKQLNNKLSTLLENKNKEELSINIFTEKEKFLLREINKLKESICVTEVVTKELNEKISKVQNEIDEKDKKDQETPSYEEVEKDNNTLDLKIRRYIRAIEICKKHRAATLNKKRISEDYSDSSQDSMLLPKKKK